MYLLRCLLVITMMVAAALSGAMAAGHSGVMEPDHEVMEMATDDQFHCCEGGTERAQNCHVLPALLPGAGPHEAAPVTGEDFLATVGILLTGFEPSGPLDPPRTM